MTPLDCTDIKALLSGLVDGEVDVATRHRAERHLAGCAECRKLIDEAEALDELILVETDALTGESALPAGFVGGVLSRTTLDRGERPYLQRWTTWTGWLAAAAALALAATLWVVRDDGTPTMRSLARLPAEPADAIPATYAPATSLRSWTLGEQTPTLATTAVLSRDDADALYFASVLLGMLAAPEVDLEQVRAAVEYDRLLPKLRSISDQLSSSERASLLAAEALLVRVVDDSVRRQDLDSIRETTDDLDLVQTLELVSNRWSGNHL